LTANDGLLTNLEVMQVIGENRLRRAGAGNNSPEFQHREEIEVKTASYIAATRSGQLSSEALRECIGRIKALDLGLTEAELLQITNLAPESDVEFYLIIEECSERLTDEQLGLVKEVVDSCYPPLV